MKKEKSIIFLIICLIFVIAETNAQNLIPTRSISITGMANDFSGGYTFAYSSSGTPWNGSLISFGGFEWNNYDCQINSDYGPNGGNHISFRTKNGDANLWNSWNEIWHSGNLNNSSSNFTAKSIKITYPPSEEKVDAFNIDVASFGTMLNANRSSFLKVKDTGSGDVAYFIIKGTGNVGIGTENPQNKLDVNGTIHSKEVKVDMLNWSDFVFKKEYNLPTLKEVEKHIEEKGHLENIPSEKEVIENGINLGEINAKLLQKIEELTLYVIEQNKKIEKLEEENIKVVDLEKRVLKIENKK